MNLPVNPPVSPMLAKLARQLPVSEGLVYEPKWDGFRCIVFRDGDQVELGSRNERPLTRYFPELEEPLRAQLPARCVLDGEIVIAGPSGLDFDALLQRIHPAESRVRMLAASTPASLVAFDLLALDQRDLRPAPFSERRHLLEQAMAEAEPPLHLTPATTDPEVARDWFDRFEGAGLDGVVAKRSDLPYREGERQMVKVKHERTADCVVAGFRWHKEGGTVGSLLLGLYDGEGNLHHVGVTASFTAARRRQLLEELAPYRMDSVSGHPWQSWAGEEGAGSTRMPGAPSRWSARRDLSWEPLRPDAVCEVAYDHLQGDRFRHGTTFRRWRPDRQPRSCTYDQLDAAVPAELAQVFGAASG
ncbi:MAG TPA: ATP-dependent DNA ligase [Acidimicrobiales bacterium]|nr:ATP-dependent DNA ligase [Acidimicrobiales bacterium]